MLLFIICCWHKGIKLDNYGNNCWCMMHDAFAQMSSKFDDFCRSTISWYVTIFFIVWLLLLLCGIKEMFIRNMITEWESVRCFINLQERLSFTFQADIHVRRCELHFHYVLQLASPYSCIWTLEWHSQKLEHGGSGGVHYHCTSLQSYIRVFTRIEY